MSFEPDTAPDSGAADTSPGASPTDVGNSDASVLSRDDMRHYVRDHLREERERQQREAPKPRAQAEPPSSKPASELDLTSQDIAELSPIEPPKFWSADQRDQFARLPRDQQEYIAAREAERNAYASRQQSEADKARNEVAAYQQQAVAIAQHAWAEREQGIARANMAIQLATSMLDAEGRQRWSHINSPEARAALAAQGGEEWQAYLEYEGRWKTTLEAARTLNAHRIQQQQQQAKEQHERAVARQHSQALRMKQWSAEQDAAFNKANPEFDNPEKAHKLRSTVLFPFLESIGIPPNAAVALSNTVPYFKDHRFQQLLWDAARFADARKKAANVRPEPKSAPLRPGTSNPRGSGATSREQANAQLARADMNEFVALTRKGVGKI
jgi:hypothetical protein